MWRTAILLSLLFLLGTLVAGQEEQQEAESEGGEQGGDGAEQGANPSLADEYLDYIQGGGGEGGAEGAGGEEEGGMPSEDMTTYTADYLLKAFMKDIGKLSDEDAKAKLDSIAKATDSDGDGTISHDELAKWLADEAEKGAAQEDVEDLGWKTIDKNEDGKATYEEIIADLDTPDQKMQAKLTEAEREQEKIKFDFADTDKDGFLTKDEFRRYAQPEMFRSMNGYLVQTALFDYDKNKDAKVSEEEYTSVPAGDTSQEPNAASASRFKELDKNKDGEISGDELKEFGEDYTLDAVVQQEAINLMRRVDTNKDGKLSLDEMAATYSLLKKSPSVPGFGQEGEGEEGEQGGQGEQGEEGEGEPEQGAEDGDDANQDGEEGGAEEAGDNEQDRKYDDDDHVAGQEKERDEL